MSVTYLTGIFTADELGTVTRITTINKGKNQNQLLPGSLAARDE
jgi:hypothetical protein